MPRLKSSIAVLFMGLACLIPRPCSAGIIQEVQVAVRSACKKELNDEDALRLVKDLYLFCVAGQNVEIDNCNVPCMKQTAGAVVGK